MNAMTCREFDQIVHGFVRMELLDLPLRDAALDHVAHCSSCSERLADATELAEATETLRSHVQGQEAPKAVEAALLASFRHHHRSRIWRRTFEWAGMGAVAAMLLVFVWTVSNRTKEQTSPSPRKDVSSQSAEPVSAQAPVLPGQEDVVFGADGEIAYTSSGLAYTPSDFVPVSFTRGISTDDAGMVVRVQLSRASLSQLGYPLAEAPNEDLIVADVLVGEDGWPRAVKVVQ